MINITDSLMNIRFTKVF